MIERSARDEKERRTFNRRSTNQKQQKVCSSCAIPPCKAGGLRCDGVGCDMCYYDCDSGGEPAGHIARALSPNNTNWVISPEGTARYSAFICRRLVCLLVLGFATPGRSQRILPISSRHHWNWCSEKEHKEAQALAAHFNKTLHCTLCSHGDLSQA